MYSSNITGKTYSGPDFLSMIEKRIRKHFRLDHRMQSSTAYCIDEPDTLAGNVLTHFLKRIFSHSLHLETTCSEDTVLLSTMNLDDYIGTHLQHIFNKQPFCTLPEKPTPLLVISRQELLLVAKLLSLNGTIPPQPHPFVEQLHNLYPQTRSSFLKSFLYIDTLLEDSAKQEEQNS